MNDQYHERDMLPGDPTQQEIRDRAKQVRSGWDAKRREVSAREAGYLWNKFERDIGLVPCWHGAVLLDCECCRFEANQALIYQLEGRECTDWMSQLFGEDDEYDI